jgi:hypothetical protein
MRDIEKARLANLFASPMLAHVWADSVELNEQLKEGILEHARRTAGEALTNVGGWHSETGRLEFCGSAGERLVGHMREMTEEATLRLYTEFGKRTERMNWTLHAWANVNAPGDFNKVHTHPGATWSGVYYVDPGNSDPAGESTPLHLSDPNSSRASIFFPELRSAWRPAAPRRSPTDFDRFQRAQGTLPVTPLLWPRAIETIIGQSEGCPDEAGCADPRLGRRTLRRLCRARDAVRALSRT